MLAGEELKAMRERCEAAKPGPYKIDVWTKGYLYFGGKFPGDSPTGTLAQCDDDGTRTFFAHARTDLPRCLDEIERLQKKVNGLCLVSDQELAADYLRVLNERDDLKVRAENAEAQAAALREAITGVRAIVDEGTEIYCDVNPEDCDHCAALGIIDDALSQPGPGAALLAARGVADAYLRYQDDPDTETSRRLTEAGFAYRSVLVILEAP